jgi:hypothetical protein
VVPAVKPAVLAVNVRDELAPEVSLPLDGLTVNHDADGVPTVHCRVPPPLLLMMMDCAAGSIPAVVVKLIVLVLICMAGAATLITTGIVTGLPAAGLPVLVSIALKVTDAL